LTVPKEGSKNTHMEGKTRKVDWIAVVRGRRQAMSPQEILYGEPIGLATRVEYRYRLRGAGSTGRVSRQVDAGNWQDEGDRSVSKGGWSDLVETVEAELRKRPGAECVTRTT
jgi:hypothetical protein